MLHLIFFLTCLFFSREHLEAEQTRSRLSKDQTLQTFGMQEEKLRALDRRTVSAEEKGAPRRAKRWGFLLICFYVLLFQSRFTAPAVLRQHWCFIVLPRRRLHLLTDLLPSALHACMLVMRSLTGDGCSLCASGNPPSEVPLGKWGRKCHLA